MNHKNENTFDESTYFITWVTAFYGIETSKLGYSNNSIHQIANISASGQNLRLKLSNKNRKTNLEKKGITITDLISQGTWEIDLKTLTNLLFNGENIIIIPPG